MEDVLVPIAFFAIIPVTVWAVSHYRHKSRARLADMVQAMSASGNPVSEDLIKTLAVQHKRPHADLRTGLIWLALGLGLLIFAQAPGDDEAARIISAVASFPILIGAVFTGFWAVITRKEAD